MRLFGCIRKFGGRPDHFEMTLQENPQNFSCLRRALNFWYLNNNSSPLGLHLLGKDSLSWLETDFPFFLLEPPSLQYLYLTYRITLWGFICDFHPDLAIDNWWTRWTYGMSLARNFSMIARRYHSWKACKNNLPMDRWFQSGLYPMTSLVLFSQGWSGLNPGNRRPVCRWC